MKKDFYWYDWSDDVIVYLNEVFSNPTIKDKEIQLDFADFAANVYVGAQSISQRALLGTLRKINVISGYSFQFRVGKTPGLWVQKCRSASESK